MCKIVPRGHSANADAYLTPKIKEYIEGFQSGFVDLHDSNTRCEFMQSDGGLVEFTRLAGLRAVLSGPAGGVVGYAKTSYDAAEAVPVIGFDMGGTSTDVSRYDGTFEHIFENTTAGVAIQSPQLDINTVAAGGGSILSWKNGMFTVGPESASSHPGPACYRKGGPLTVTDANVVLGRIVPDYFPKIFGPGEDLPLDVEASRSLLQQLTDGINADTGKQLSVEEVALGFLTVANESMCRPIRSLTEAKGFDAAKHNLASFGGAGGQHATSIARMLGVKRVLIHKYSSILSAYGMALADVVHEEQAPSAMLYSEVSLPIFKETLAMLEQKAENALVDQGIRADRIVAERYLNMRYQRSDNALMIKEEDDSFMQRFIDKHRREFGFTPVDAGVIVDDIRVRAIGRSNVDPPLSPFAEYRDVGKWFCPASNLTKPLYFEQRWRNTPIFELRNLVPGHRIAGPALIIDATQTLLVEPNTTANILSDVVIIDVETIAAANISAVEADPIQLSIFGHRFMGIAEQMGRALQKTSVSTNIKERLDFSCTIFSPDGSLVANAPHVPAMIGSMAYAVKWQIEHWKGGLRPGDVILSNSPVCGGVHLPDMTTITPVFNEAGNDIIFWTAARGHHADVGGLLPGSMPPTSKWLWEEGAVFEAFKVVENGIFKEDELAQKLLEPAQFPGCSGTRCLQDNISDIRAQIAANHRGAQLIHGLIYDYGMDVVQFYMQEIQGVSELAVRTLLKRIAEKNRGKALEAIDHMDDGTPICLKVDIDEGSGEATFDFTGTGSEVYGELSSTQCGIVLGLTTSGNWNAPIAITHSSILYALRCMVGAEMPLNQGAIRTNKIIVPDRSLLKPGPKVACCAGNVLTSQRVVDVIFLAFGVMAASQGCMNNFSFGSDEPGSQFGFYETICGGSGAGPFGPGTSGVHTNMTNTRITDPEIMEKRYPIILRRFCLRPGSGGVGQHDGGDGIIRDVEFSMPIKASILSERRAFSPYGMKGGGDGMRGLNTWIRGEDGSQINIGGKNTVQVAKGDRILIETPGGGAWGAPTVNGTGTQAESPALHGTMIGNGSVGNSSAVSQSA